MQLLRKLSDFTGYHLHARDGEIGKLEQVYFDDRLWAVRYFVVHTGNWLLGKDVLIVPTVVTTVDETNKCVNVDLTQEQIKRSPPVGTSLPVSQHYEHEYYQHYGWEPYWADPMFGAAAPYVPPANKQLEGKEPEHPHLRSSDEVHGYHIHALDGVIGHVEDFIIEDPVWAIRYLEIDTCNLISGKKVLVSPTWIKQVDWGTKEVTVNLTREAIKSAPAYDESRVISTDYLVELYKYYGLKADHE